MEAHDQHGLSLQPLSRAPLTDPHGATRIDHPQGHLGAGSDLTAGVGGAADEIPFTGHGDPARPTMT
jgi:hypothetical protein